MIYTQNFPLNNQNCGFTALLCYFKHSMMLNIEYERLAAYQIAIELSVSDVSPYPGREP